MKIIKRPTTKFIHTFSSKILVEENPCPFCGENKLYDPYSSSSGIEITRVTWFKGIFKIRKYTETVIKCYTCRAKWKKNYKREVIKIDNQ